MGADKPEMLKNNYKVTLNDRDYESQRKIRNRRVYWRKFASCLVFYVFATTCSGVALYAVYTTSSIRNGYNEHFVTMSHL